MVNKMTDFHDQLCEMLVALDDYQDWEFSQKKEFDIDNCTAAQMEEHNQDMRHYVNKGVWL
jgi:hypothetical protein